MSTLALVMRVLRTTSVEGRHSPQWRGYFSWLLALCITLFLFLHHHHQYQRRRFHLRTPALPFHEHHSLKRQQGHSFKHKENNASTMALPILDHIAILVSIQTLQTVTDQLKDSLIVIDGGAHADGLTVNKLIHLADGTYIEFIAFVQGVDPEKRRAHRWGNLEEGKIADWAHTLHSEADYVQLQKRVADAAAGVTYSDLVPLQRHRPDGVLMKCLVSVALDSEGKRVFPATVPFWCVDVTERHLRSPFKGEDGPHEYTKHPSHAKGLSRITVLLPEKDIPTYKPVYDAIHNSVATSEAGVFSWPYELPAGPNTGSNQVSLSTLTNGSSKVEVRLTLLGTKESPKSIELLPGLVLDFEAAA